MSDMLDKIARIAVAIERAGGDFMGSVETIHQDFMELLKLIPKEAITSTRVTPAAGERPFVEQQAKEDGT